jgi:isocitrate dehydrogenase kinase/phosphatase
MNVSKQLKEEFNPFFNSISLQKKPKKRIKQYQDPSHSIHVRSSIERYKSILKKSSFNADLRRQKSEKYRAKVKARKNPKISETLNDSLPKVASNLLKTTKNSFPKDLLEDFPFLSSPTPEEEIKEMFSMFDFVLRQSKLN